MAPFAAKPSSKPGAAALENEFHHWPQLSVPKVCALNWCCDVILMLVTYPLWHLKTLEQAGTTTSAMQAARRIVGQHGFRGLYRGSLFGITGLLPASNAYICTYECSKFHLGASLPHAVAPALAAALAECTYVALATPVEVVTVRAQCGGQLGTPKRPARTELSAMWKSGGVRNLYRGGALTLASSLPESVCWWLVYENCKAGLRKSELSGAFVYSCSALAASAISTLLVNPVDVLKTRAQAGQALQKLRPGEPFWHLCVRGLAPRLFSALIGGLFESATYEVVMHYGKKS